MTDSELISRYVDHDAHDAFEELVQRHVNWINSMAARLTHDRTLADDVTQAVFLLLARKAGTLRRQTVVSTWLFTVTRYCAANALRREIRRKEHERRAATMAGMQADQSFESSNWDDLAPVLDELVASLRTGDRQIVLMRFYEQKSFPEIGEALRISEEAARKRVSRSIEKLRELFARRGVTVGAAALATTLSASLSKPASAAVIASSAAQAGAAATLTPSQRGPVCHSF